MKTQIILFNLFIAFFSATGQVQIDKPYDFPTKPGSTKWESLSTGQEMVDVCQIPDSILSKLSTQALAQTCLNYPLFFQHTALNDERKAIDEIIKEFNGLNELTLREDGLKELINLYKEIPVEKTPYLQTNADDVPYKIIYIELILANDRFIGKAKKTKLNDIKSAFLIKYNSKLKNQNIHSLFSIRKTLLLGAITTLKLDSLNSVKSDNKEKIQHFIDQYEVAKADELTIISKIITEQ